MTCLSINRELTHDRYEDVEGLSLVGTNDANVHTPSSFTPFDDVE